MKGYKTVIANLIVMAGAILAIGGVEVAQETLNDFGAALVALIGAGNILLRAVTNSPVFKKD